MVSGMQTLTVSEFRIAIKINRTVRIDIQWNTLSIYMGKV